MTGPSLLARIKNPAQGATRLTVPEAEVREAVLEHLRQMCSTRQGSVITAPDYGVCTVSELIHLFPDAIAMVGKSIKQTIEKYEPRLQSVMLRHVPTERFELVLRFEIQAQLVHQRLRLPVRFTTELDESKRLRVL